MDLLKHEPRFVIKIWKSLSAVLGTPGKQSLEFICVARSPKDTQGKILRIRNR